MTRGRGGSGAEVSVNRGAPMKEESTTLQLIMTQIVDHVSKYLWH